MSLSIVISFFGVLGFSRLLEPQVLKKESVNREVSLCRRDLSGFINVKKCLKDSSGKMHREGYQRDSTLNFLTFVVCIQKR